MPRFIWLDAEKASLRMQHYSQAAFSERTPECNALALHNAKALYSVSWQQRDFHLVIEEIVAGELFLK